jgi:chemotaxis protein MotB
MKDLSNRHPIPGDSLNQVPLKKVASPLRFQKKSPQPEKGNEIWLITLTDVFMLLMVCFVFLFGMTLYQQKATGPLSSPLAKPDIRTSITEISPLTQAALPGPPSKAAVSSLESDLLSMLSLDQNQQNVTVERRSQYIVLTFPERIMFDSGKADVKFSVQPLLEKVAVVILNHPDLFVEVHGYTDDRPIHNQRYSSNWELSLDRATQVARVLVNLGIQPTNVSIKGFGENHPIYANDNDSNRLKNRRVEIQCSLTPSRT